MINLFLSIRTSIFSYHRR